MQCLDSKATPFLCKRQSARYLHTPLFFCLARKTRPIIETPYERTIMAILKNHELTVKLEAENANVNHDVKLDPESLYQVRALVNETGKHLIRVIAVAALAKTATDIVVHIAKTRIK